MGTKYSSQSTSGYNSSPPPDDGTQVASNLITWAGVKTKLADVLKTFGEAINSALVSALDLSARAISSNDTAIASDHWKTLQVTGTTTISLSSAATVGAGYEVGVLNAGSGVVTVTPAGSDTIAGVSASVLVPIKSTMIFRTNSALTGYNVVGQIGGIVAQLDAIGGVAPLVTTSQVHSWVSGTSPIINFLDSARTANNRIFELSFGNAGAGVFALRAINDAYNAAATVFSVSGGQGAGIGSFTLGSTTTLDLGTLGQINFPATQNPSAGANVLDDYEEGTWTPTVGGSATYTVQLGTYTKIGRLVFVQLFLTINSIGTGSANTISGLPFAATGDTTIPVGTFAALATNAAFLTGLISAATSAITLQGTAASGAATATFNGIGNSTILKMSGCYQS